MCTKSNPKIKLPYLLRFLHPLNSKRLKRRKIHESDIPHADQIYRASASQIFGVPVKKNGINGHLRQKGKVAELACGYGGSVGAMKAMGGGDLNMTDEELKQLVKEWRAASPNIVSLWHDIENTAKTAIICKYTQCTHGLTFTCKSGMGSLRRTAHYFYIKTKG